MILIIGIIIILFIIAMIEDVIKYKPPSCYKPEDPEKSSTFNPGCYGYNCAFKYSCRYYKNYINDN